MSGRERPGTRRELHRKDAGVGAVGVAGLAGCAGSGGDEPAFEEGFEEGLGGWGAGATIGSEVGLADVDWEVDVSDAEATAGDRSPRIWNRGDSDDGVTWVVHPVPIESGSSYQLEVSGQFWSESESLNAIRHSLMRPGPEPPETEEGFPQPGLNTTDLGETPYGGLRDALWLAGGWREYHYVDDLSVRVESR